MEPNPGKRPWRKLVKKLQRKKKRQKLAQQRDIDLEKIEFVKMKDPQYKLQLEQQEEVERQKLEFEESYRQEQEELWLRRELLAKMQFRRDELKRKAEEAKLEVEKAQLEEKLKALEETSQKKRAEIRLQAEAAAKEFDNIMTSMQHYLEDHTMKTPARLNSILDSRPGEKSCDFFQKTNCCRFGFGCTFNHKRPMLSKIIIIKHFFQHPLLEQTEHEEYLKTDSDLELTDRDLRDAYDEFCQDVWPVLEDFGKIINFRTVKNVQAHLRGHVFVEYADKRSALKAFISLQNRYYASKRLNVEFSNMQQWRTGVCGMRSVSFLTKHRNSLSLIRICPKGVKCNFLHLMNNMGNKYNSAIDKPPKTIHAVSDSGSEIRPPDVISWNLEDTLKDNNSQSRNWRWSESPEIELKIGKNKCDSSIIKTETMDKNVSKTPRKKSPSRSKSKTSSVCIENDRQLKSCSIRSECDKKSRNSASEDRKSKRKSSVTENQECEKHKKSKNENKKRKKHKSKRRKHSHRTSSNYKCTEISTSKRSKKTHK